MEQPYNEVYQFLTALLYQFTTARDMIGDSCQDMGQVSTRIDTVEFAASDQRIHRCGPLAPAIGACEEEILSTQAHTTQRVFRDVVIYFDGTIVAVQHERIPLVQGVVDGLGRIRLCRQRLEFFPQPRAVALKQRLCLLLSHTQSLVRRFAANVRLYAIELTDVSERLSGRLRWRAHVNVIELATCVRVAPGFANRAVAKQLVETRICIGLQDLERWYERRPLFTEI